MNLTKTIVETTPSEFDALAPRLSTIGQVYLGIGYESDEEDGGSLKLFPGDPVIFAQLFNLGVDFSVDEFADLLEQVFATSRKKQRIDLSTGLRVDRNVLEAVTPEQIAKRFRPADLAVDQPGLVMSIRVVQEICERAARGLKGRQTITPKLLADLAASELGRVSRMLASVRRKLMNVLDDRIAAVQARRELDQENRVPAWRIQADTDYRQVHDWECSRARVAALEPATMAALQAPQANGTVAEEDLAGFRPLFAANGSTGLLSLTSNGQKRKFLPTLTELCDREVTQKIELLHSVDSLEELEFRLMLYREALEAIQSVAAGSQSAEQMIDLFQDKARLARQLHHEVMVKALETTRPLAQRVVEHVSFFVEARIPIDRPDLRGSIHLVTKDARALINHPDFGSRNCMGPIEIYGNIHRDAVGLLVLSGELAENDELLRLGSPCGRHRAICYVSIPQSAFNDLSGLVKGHEAEAHVVLVHIPIRVRPAGRYENKDFCIGGAFAAAGREFYTKMVSESGGLGVISTGNRPTGSLSNAYAFKEAPFVHDFGECEMDLLQLNCLVGASATDRKTKTSSTNCIYGSRTARNSGPLDQIPTRFALNHFARELQIEGSGLLTDASSLAMAITRLERELRYQLVGLSPKPFQELDLIVDLDSEEGKRALAQGGLLLRAQVVVNSQNEWVEIHIVAKPGMLIPPAA